MASLRSHVFRLFLKWFIARRFRRAGESVEELRRAVEGLARYQRVPPGVDVRPATAGGVAGEWVASPRAAEDRAVLFLHGGACIMGSPATYRELAARIALACGARVIAINYRLAPEHPFPAAVDDAVTAYQGLVEQGLSPAGMVIGGDSSGGE